MPPAIPPAPSIGRIVHVILPSGAHRPGIITSIQPTTDSAANPISVSVFLEDGDMPEHRGAPSLNFAQIKDDETGEAAMTWHWPEREAAPMPAPAPAAVSPSQAVEQALQEALDKVKAADQAQPSVAGRE